MIRESMKILPEFSQPFLTWLTAKPLVQDLDSRTQRTVFYHIFTSTGFIVGGAALAAFGYLYGYIALMVLGVVLTTGGLKKMQVMIVHNCAHNMVFADRETNLWAGTFISGLFMLKPFEIYKREHLLHHDHKTLLTKDDDTLSFLQSTVGLDPSDSILMMWIKLVGRAFSPFVIMKSIVERIKAMATAPNRKAGVASLACWGALLAGASLLGVLDVFLVAVFAPIFIGFHISSTFRLAAEHTWPSVEVLERRGIEFVSEATTGVFIGEELRIPENAGRIQSILRIAFWLVKMLTFHLFVRVFIMVGDTPCHDFHHRRPKSRDWPNYIVARERDMNAGSKPYPSNYVDYWGYLTAVTINFRNYQNARPYYHNQQAA